MSNNILIIIVILIAAGLFGGLINFFRTYNYKRFKKTELIKSLIFGVGASFLIPIIFKLLQLKLLETSQEEPLDYFYIFSFGLIVGIFASDFIDRVGKILLRRVDDLEKDFQKTKEDFENSATELDNYELVKTFDFELKQEHIDILEIMSKSKYVYRAINGIKTESRKNKEEVRSILYELKKYKLVELVERPNGPKWKLTTDGKDYIPFYYTQVDESSY